jgi:hypothetical protein
MKLLSAPFADVELLMNTPLPTAPVRHVIMVTLLSVACAFCSGCHSGVRASAAAPAAAGSTSGNAAPWQSQAPAAPLDERPVTTMETVGAAEA